jgi:hypothetical protein
MRTNLYRKKPLIQNKKHKKNNHQATTTAMEEMNGTTQRKVDGHIMEMPKLLIWSENTYEHKGKKNRKGRGRVGAESRISKLYFN